MEVITRALGEADWTRVADIYRQGIRSGDATFEGEVGWSNELGHGMRAPKPAQPERDASVRTVER